jgi:hypothetical protein
MRGWVLLLISVLFMGGCIREPEVEREYVCVDGRVVSSPNLCPRETTTIAFTSTTSTTKTTSITPASTTSTITQPETQLSFRFNSGKGTCSTGEEDTSLSIDGGTLSLTGALRTPTPCYTLTASQTLYKSVFRVEISSQAKAGVCVLCLGSVPFNFQVSGLPDGTYRLEVLYNSKDILSDRVLLTSSQGGLRFFCGGIAGIRCPKGYECVLEEPGVSDGGGKCVRSEQAAAESSPSTTSTLVSSSSITSVAVSTTLSKTSTSSSSTTSLTETTTTTPSSTTTLSAGAVIGISAVQFDAEGDDRKAENLNTEWVEVKNSGNAPQDLSGWTLSDASNHTYTFPQNFVLGAGDSVKVRTGSGTDSTSDLYWGRGSPIWNNDGDTVTLKDEDGRTVDSHTE